MSRPRDLDIFLQYHASSTAGVGISPNVGRALDQFFADQAAAAEAAASTSSASVSTTVKKIDPFKAWSASVLESAKKAAAKTKLMGKGLPEGLADSVIGTEGWKRVYSRLMNGGRDALAKFIEAWSKGAEGQGVIGSQIDKIVEGIKKRLEKGKAAIDDFKAISSEFAKTIMDFGAISTFQPDAGVPITAQGITANIRQRLAMAREFSGVLKSLASGKVALNPGAIIDIAKMGPLEGLPYAKALLDAGAQTISDLNSLRTDFVSPATLFGQTVAEATTNTSMAQLQAAQTFTFTEGSISIEVNGDVGPETIAAIRRELTAAITDIGRESRAGRRTGVR